MARDTTAASLFGAVIGPLHAVAAVPPWRRWRGWRAMVSARWLRAREPGGAHLWCGAYGARRM